jgi:hypothetical protein
MRQGPPTGARSRNRRSPREGTSPSRTTPVDSRRCRSRRAVDHPRRIDTSRAARVRAATRRGGATPTTRGTTCVRGPPRGRGHATEDPRERERRRQGQRRSTRGVVEVDEP